MSDQTPNPALKACEDGLLRAADRTRRGHIKCAVYLLKAHALHALSPGEQRATARAAKALKGPEISGVPLWDTRVQPTAEPASFDAWLEDVKERGVVGFSRSTAYRYMKSAVCLGLGAESTEEDVDAIPAERLADLRIGSPSGLALPEPGTDAPAPPKKSAPLPPSEKAKQLWLPFFDELGTITKPDSVDGKYLDHLPLVSADPDEPTLSALRLRLETALQDVKEAEARAKAQRRR